MLGGKAVALRLDELAFGTRYARSAQAQIRALTGSSRGYEAAARAGLAPSRRTLLNWLSGATAPSAANQARIHAAYADYRRTVAESRLKRHLERAGAGTRVEIHPLEGNARTHRGNIDVRYHVVRDWGPFLNAWKALPAPARDLADRYFDDMQDAWIDVADELGSEGGAYYQVVAVGF